MVAIIMAVVMQIDLQYLTHFFQQRERFVNSRMTHGGELAFDLCVELPGTGVPLADRNQTDQLNPLGGQPEIALLQCGYQLTKSDTWIGH